MSTPTISSASYNASTGVLTLAGSNLTLTSGNYKPTDFKLTGDAGLSYKLTNGSAVSGTPTSTSLKIQLSSVDQLAVDGLLNKDGSTGNNGSSIYALSAIAGWDTGAAAINTQSLSVSNVTAPTLSAVTYNTLAGVFVFNGSHLSNQGLINGLNISDFTLGGGSGAFGFDSQDVVSKFSSTGFTVTLNSVDKALVNNFATLNGQSPASGSAYNITTKANWDSDSGAAITTLAVTASGNAPVVSSVSYNASSGILTISGSNLSSTASGYKVTDFKLTGEDGLSYQLTSSSSVSGTPTSTSVAIQLSTADKLAISGLLNQDGVIASNGTSSYALAASSGWDTNASAISNHSVAVNSVTVPTLSAVSYDAGTGVFTITGSNLSNLGLTNGLNISDFHLNGGSGSFSFDNHDVVSKLTASSFTVTLSSADKTLVSDFVTQNGYSPATGSAYSLAATANWDSNIGLAFSGLAVNAGGVAPTVSSVTYNALYGLLTLHGSDFSTVSSNYLLKDISLRGDSSGSYSLSSSSYLYNSSTATELVIKLSAADQVAVDGLLNNNGGTALDAHTSYALSASGGWDSGIDTLKSLAVTVSNVSTPALSAVNYNAATDVFTFTGSNLVNHGSSNGIKLSDIQFTAGANAHYTFSANDTVSYLTANSFTVKLSSADASLVNAVANANGLSSASGTAYNIAVAANWDSSMGAATSQLAVTVKDVVPVISSVSYDASSGVITLDGSHLTTNAGDYTAGDLALIGNNGLSYLLTSGSLVSGTPTSSSVSFLLANVDHLAVDGMLDRDGTSSLSGNAYKLISYAGWDIGVTAKNTMPVTVNNAFSPTISTISYNTTSGVFTFTGENLSNKGYYMGLSPGNFTFNVAGKGGFTLNAFNDAMNNFTSTGFIFTLSGGDKTTVNALLNENGYINNSGAAYGMNISAGWDSLTGAAIHSKLVLVEGLTPSITAVAYNTTTGILTLTGSNLPPVVGSYNFSDITISGDKADTYALSSACTVTSSSSTTSVGIQLSAADQVAVNGLLNNNGSTGNDGKSTFSLSTSSGWDSGTDTQSSHSITVSNVAAPALTAVSFDAATGVFSFTGSNLANLGSLNGIALADLQLTGGSGSYTFSSSDTVTNLSATGFTVTLGSTDLKSVLAFVNANGDAPQSGAAYNLATTANWDADSGTATSTLAVTVNSIPSVSNAAYNAATGILTLSGTNLTLASSDYTIADFVIKGDGGGAYTLTTSSALAATPTSTGINIQLSAADQLAVDGLLNQNGATANSGAAYQVTLGNGWDGSAGFLTTTNLSVSNVTSPSISAVNYNATTGVLSFTGSNLDNHGASAGINIADFSLSNGSGSYSFNTSNDLQSNLTASGFTLTLNSADQVAVNALLNANGVDALNGSAYNLALTAGWDSNSGVAGSLGVTVSNSLPQPTLATVSYNAVSGAFTFTGSNLDNYGSISAITQADLSLTTDAGSYTFNSKDVVSSLTATGFTLTLSSADLTTVDYLLTTNGSASLAGVAYNLAATAGWETDSTQAIATQAVTVADLPSISAASYDAATGQLSLTGVNLTGYTMDYTLSDFKISGDSGVSYNLTGGTLSGTPSTGSLVIQLTAADELAINGLLNADGTVANSGASYNLAISSGWDTHAPAITTLPISVNTVTAPNLSTVSYNASTGSFTFSGANLDNAGAGNGINLNNFTLNDGSQIFVFNSLDKVSNLTSTSFTVALGSTDEAAVNAFINANGAASVDGNAYTLAVAANWDSDSGAAITQSVNVSGITPVISSVSYNATTGVLSLNGSDLSSSSGSYKANDLTITGYSNNSYQLSSSSTISGTPTSSQMNIQLSAADQMSVDGLLNKNGGTANDNTTVYNLAASAGWDSGANTITTQGITVSNVTSPSLSSVLYNAAAGTLTFTGSNFKDIGHNAGVNPVNISINNDTGSFTLNTGDSYGQSSTTGFTITLSSTDHSTVNAILNANGSVSATGGVYNLTTKANWDGDTGSAISTQAVTVTGLAPVINSVGYNAATGILSLVGSKLSTLSSSYTLTDLSLTGDGGGNYALTSGSTISSSVSGSNLNIQLSATDQLAINGLLNQNGVTANDNSTAYGLSAVSGWDAGKDTLVALPVVVSNTSSPLISAVAYDATSGIFTVTGDYLDNHGSVSGINLSEFKLSSGSQTFSFNSSSDTVSSLTSTGFSISLNNIDMASISAILNADGTASLAGNAYNLAATSNWDSDSGAAISKLAVTTSNVLNPTISAVSYNTVSGALTISGANLDNYGTANSIVPGNFMLSGGGSSIYNLSTSDTVTNLSATSFTINLSTADQTNINAIFNADGLSPNSGAAYNLAVAANWDSNSGAAISTQAVTVSGVPTLSAASYNATTGILTLTGNYLTTTASNYVLSDLSLTGDGGNSYKLSSASTLAAAPTSSAISVQLSATDQLQLDGLLNKAGALANDGATAYALAAVKGWDSGAAALTSLPVTVSNVIAPTITGVSYNTSTGVLNFTGANLATAGSNNAGINLNHFTFNIGGNSHTLSSNDTISNMSSTGFTVTLGVSDQDSLNSYTTALYNNQSYNLALTANWDSDFGAAMASLPVSASGIPLIIQINSGISSPLSVAVNSAGYIFTADTGNNAIKVVTSTGIYSLFTGLNRPEAITFNNNNLYIADSGANAILEEKSGSNSATVIASSGLNNPADLAVYNGNVYIADYGDSAIKEIVNGSSTVSKVLTTGLTTPEGIAFDSSGNLYISDSGDNAIKELSATTNTLTTILSTGISTPGGIVVDNYGNLFFADSGNNAIKEIVAGTNTALTLYSTGLKNPIGITLDANGNLYIANTGNNAVDELVHTQYYFNITPTSASVQTVTNLWENTGQIQLSTSVFTAFANQANVTTANFSNATSPTSSTDYLYYNATTGGLYYETDGSGGKVAPVEIAIIGSTVHPAALSAGDFSLVA